MPIFHKIIFKHIFHKSESLFMLPKGKFICMFKKSFVLQVFLFLTILKKNLFFWCFFPFFLVLKPLVSAKISIFLGIKIRVKSSFSYPVFGRSGCRLSNSTAIFLPNVSDIWRLPNPVKIQNVPFFITKSAMEPKNE